MKTLVCKMCNSIDLLKRDGMFICQSCGCKYSSEEAEKMLFEGTVKVDNSDFVEKCLANARRAKRKEDWEETEKYYNLVEQNDPSNIEAIFYSSYGKAKCTLVDSDIYKRQAAFKVLQNCVSIVDDNLDIEKEAEQKEIILQIKSDVCSMACSSYVYNKKTQSGTAIWTDKSETEELFFSLVNELIKTIDNIIPKYSSLKKEQALYLYESMIELLEFEIKNINLSISDIASCEDLIWQTYSRIREEYPTYVIPEIYREDPQKRRERENEKKRKEKVMYMLIAGATVLLIIIAFFADL